MSKNRKNVWLPDDLLAYVDTRGPDVSLSGRICTVLDRYRALMLGAFAIARHFTADEQKALTAAHATWPELFGDAERLRLDLADAFARRAPSEKALAKKLRELDLLNRVRLAEWLEYQAQQAPRPDTTTTAGDRT